jgi:hypothetical protein
VPINTNDQFIASRKPRKRIIKANSGTLVVGRLHSTWLFGGFPGSGTLLGANTALQYLRATQGSCGPDAAPLGGNTFFLGATRLRLAGSVTGIAGDIDLYDRMVAQACPNVTLNTAQTLPAQALPARAGVGVEVEAFVEVQAATGAAAVTVTINYTNASGTAGRTSTASLPASSPVGVLIPFTLQAGDTGVQSVQTMTLSASVVSGNICITLGKYLGVVPCAFSNISEVQDYAELGLPDVSAEVCTWIVVNPNTTAGVSVQGTISYNETTP